MTDEDNLKQLGRIVAGEEPPPWWMQATPADATALTFRERVALRAFDRLIERGWPACKAGESWSDACRMCAARVRDLTDAVCRAMERPATERPALPTREELLAWAHTGNEPPAEWFHETADPFTPEPAKDGIQTERNRCVAILKAAKVKTHRKAQYVAMAAIRECLDAVKSGQPCDEVMSDDAHVFVPIAGRLVPMPREYAALIKEAVEAETRRGAKFIRNLRLPDGCRIPNRHYVADTLLESAGLEPETKGTEDD